MHVLYQVSADQIVIGIYLRDFTFIWKLENQNFPGIHQMLFWLSCCSAKLCTY